MIKKVLNNYSKKYLSVWVILAFDLILVFGLYIFSFLLRYRFDFGILENEFYWLYIGWGGLVAKAFVITAVYAIFFLSFKTYRGILRHTTIHEAYVILKSCFFSVVVLLSFSLIIHFLFSRYLNEHKDSVLYLPKIVLVLHSLGVIAALLIYRIIIKEVFTKYFKSQVAENYKVIIYGAGSSGMVTLNALKNDFNTVYNIIGFIDDDPNKVGKKIEEFTIFNRKKGFEKIISEEVDQIIISIQNLDTIKKREIIKECLKFDLEIKDVPPVENWINEELTTNQIKKVKVEDLLGRKPIKLDSQNIFDEVKGKTILVSGAAGSIGAEIVRQLIYFEPKKIIGIDQAESFLYDLQVEIKTNAPQLFELIDFVIANVKEKDRLEEIFDQYNPDIIYHAAAYKHVPLMENFPFEAFNVNVVGTKNLADLAVAHNVSKFVMVSTDKAVNPTNVMGATKRIAEIYTQSLQEIQNNTHFITTRFGNVLGSNGSVIPLFKKQIETGGPVTLTHKDITRYFMTIPEACNLVLEAGAMGIGGEIFVFDMGDSIKIYDLAINMIKLSGLEPFVDIDVKEVGLRPGEKLYEELLNSKENTLPTHHKKILIAEIRKESNALTNDLIQKMQLLNRNQEFELIKLMKEIVPEFKSNNSRFELLDKENEN
ncbi:capsular polysaccharide biosynthesis protein CapD [Flavobacteriaceae bacterium UJ101]|nr:capsular polysaccharide biosynthesis protein CapD [Flavobacteriaceae bacterium UJ101]